MKYKYPTFSQYITNVNRLYSDFYLEEIALQSGNGVTGWQNKNDCHNNVS